MSWLDDELRKQFDPALYVWQVFEDGEWGTIGGMKIGTSTWAPLVTRNESIAHNGMRELAQMHARATKLPVRLARYELAEVECTI